MIFGQIHCSTIIPEMDDMKRERRGKKMRRRKDWKIFMNDGMKVKVKLTKLMERGRR